MKQPRQLSLFDEHEMAFQSTKKGIGTKERLNDYDGFVEKFKVAKTTDDCYTPPAVYDAVVGWCKDQGLISEATPIVRPFYPGNDYKEWDYPEGCAVIDNPPFSIYSEIVRWFIARGVRFLLFGPQLTLKVRNADVCYLPVSASITYENGAVVNTGFVTNMIEGVRIWTAPSLHKALRLASPPKTIMPKNTYPLELLTCATIGKISVREVDLKIMADECAEVQQVASLAKVKKSLFGGVVVKHESRSRESRSRESRRNLRATERTRTVHHQAAWRKEQRCCKTITQQVFITRLNQQHYGLH